MNKNIKVKVITLISTLAITSSLFAGCGNASAKSASTANSKSTTQNNKKGNNFNKQFIKEINSAKSALDISMDNINNKNIADAVIKAKSKGIVVRAVTYRNDTSDKKTTQLNRLKNVGVSIKIAKSKNLIQDNFIIADKSTDALNNKKKDSTKTVQQLEDEFNKMWNDSTNFTNFK